jgi:hypothetical protein
MAEHEVPDLHDVEEKIHAAHEAEDQLLTAMPNAIQPDDDAYQGMSGPTEGDVEQIDESEQSDDERQAEAAEPTPTEQVTDDLTGNEDRDDVDEAAIESTVVEDDSPPPGDPDHD